MSAVTPTSSYLADPGEICDLRLMADIHLVRTYLVSFLNSSTLTRSVCLNKFCKQYSSQYVIEYYGTGCIYVELLLSFQYSYGSGSNTGESL